MRSHTSLTTIRFQAAAFGLCVGCALSAAAAVSAQNVDFEIGNLSLEQIVVTSQALPSANSASSMNVPFQTTSSSVILQGGVENSALFYSEGTVGNATVSYQLGQQNTTQGIILDSPGSAIAQFQLGEVNRSDVAIVGGSDNSIATVQIGNRLGVSVGLLDSEGTTVVYGQVGNDYNGSVVFKNAPAGTVITLN